MEFEMNKHTVLAITMAFAIAVIAMASIPEESDAATVTLDSETIENYLNGETQQYEFSEGDYVLSEKFGPYDNQITHPMVFSGTCTLDLNGFGIFPTENVQYGIINQGVLTVKDSSDDKSGSIALSYSSGDGVAILNEGSLTVDGGSFSADYSIMNSASNTDTELVVNDVWALSSTQAIRVCSGSVEINGGDITDGHDYGIAIIGDASEGFISVEVNGGDISASSGAAILVQGSNDPERPVKLVFNDGSISVNNCLGISGNGAYDYTDITIKGGSIESQNQVAVFNPQIGDLTVTGGTITGYTGIQFCGSGTLTIDSGTITGTGECKPMEKVQTDGTFDDGAAVSLITRGNGYQDDGAGISVRINGGTFESMEAAAIQSYKMAYSDSSWHTGSKSGLDTALDTVDIRGGKFTSPDGTKPISYDSDDESTGIYVISGGTYSADVDSVADLEASVAKVGDRYYTDIRQAISDAPEGETVLLLKPITVTGTNLNIRNGITLDLGGKTITIGETGTYNVGIVFSGGNCYLKNGTIIDTRQAAESKSMFTIYVVGENTSLTTTNLNITVTNSTLKNSTSVAAFVTNYGSLTLDKGTTIDAVGDIQEGSSGSTGAFIQGVSGTSSTPTKLTVLDGVNIHVNGFAISGNGTDGYSDTTIDIRGGEYISDNAAAVYHPQNGKLTVANATLTGTTGIELRSGTAIIGDGAVITGTGNPFESDPNGNGSTTTGAGIAVVQHTTKKEISLTVNGGTISGYRAIYEENLQNNDDASIEKIDIVLNGGTFEAINGGTESVKIVDSGIIGDVVYGGSYNTDVSDYTVDGADVTEDDDGNQVVLPPVRFEVDQINTYTPSFELPYVSKGGEPTFSSEDGVTFNGNIATVIGTPYSVTIKMTATYNGVTCTDEVFVLCYITDDGSEEGNVMITSPESAWAEFYDRVDDVVGEPDQDGSWIIVDVARTDALNDPVRFSVTDVLRTQGQMNYDFGDEGYQVFAVHFGDEIDYPAVEIIDGEVYITPSGFSTFAFYVYLPEPEIDVNPPIIWDDDDDYVPIPPVVVDDSSDDDTVTIVACAAAAVVAAQMAVFLIIERRK